MPTEVCSVCGKFFKIRTRDWKLLLTGSDRVDSMHCVLEWIKRPRKPLADHLIQEVAAVPGSGVGTYPPFRSTLEFKFSVWLTRHLIRYDYEPVAFPAGNGWYIPDFFLPDYQCFIETKGAWAVGSKMKMMTIFTQYPGLPLLIIPWTLGRTL